MHDDHASLAFRLLLETPQGESAVVVFGARSMSNLKLSMHREASREIVDS